MFCPECGHPLESPDVKFCTNCGSRVIPPEPVETPEKTPLDAPEPVSENETAQTPAEPSEPTAQRVLQTEERTTRSKRCTAALLLGAGAFVFAVLTAIARELALDLRILRILAAGAYFLAPLACCFGILGIVATAKNKRKRGLPSAIAGLLLGLLAGVAASYLLLARMLGL